MYCWSGRSSPSLLSYDVFCALPHLVLNIGLRSKPMVTVCRVGILAFHKALVDQPQDPLAVAAFSIAVHTGGSLSKAIKVARKISQPHNRSFCELSEREGLDSDDALMDEIMNLAASVRAALHKMRDEHFVSQALIKYPQAPHSDLVRTKLLSTF